MLIGYIRVSTNDQNTDLQRNALMCAGCELKWFTEFGHLNRGDMLTSEQH
ncbi:recombinase family protein, partial [Escherichia coli]